MKSKKIAALLLIAFLVIGMMIPTETKRAEASNQIISLSSVENVYATAYNRPGGYGIYHYEVYVIVENLTYDKTIFMHYQDQASEGWINSSKATYVKSLDNNKELWVIEGYVSGEAEFALYYQEANAWDNNNTNNYKLLVESGILGLRN